MRSALILAVSMSVLGCRLGARSEVAALPPAQAFDRPSEFTGAWIGEIGGLAGSLDFTRLGSGRYYGAFQSDDNAVKYVVLARQVPASRPDGRLVPSNLVEITWQDGRGGKGRGWLLINREDSALTGDYGYGSAASGAGAWTFIRAE